MKTSWWRWLLVALWMGVIYMFSAQTGEMSGSLSGGLTQWLVSHLTPQWDTLSVAAREELLVTWRLLIRKGAHMAEFAVLAVLFFGAWRNGGRRTLARTSLLTAPCCLLTAMADEFHQRFVPSRGPSISDVFIDFGGALLGILLMLLVFSLAKRGGRSKESYAFS